MTRRSRSYTVKGIQDMPMTASTGDEHWRHFRMLFHNGANKYYDQILTTSYWRRYSDNGSTNHMDFWLWLATRLPSGVRVVYDAVYKCNGLHFDDDYAKIGFVLIYGNKPSN